MSWFWIVAAVLHLGLERRPVFNTFIRITYDRLWLTLLRTDFVVGSIGNLNVSLKVGHDAV